MEKLGIGVLNWDRVERVCDRYGTVTLFASHKAFDERKVSLNTSNVELGTRGYLVALVKETRKSRHIGDIYHNIAPETPEVGQRIVLGEGRIFVEDENVGLEPLDSRESHWLDVRALYKVHDQTVELYFEEING